MKFLPYENITYRTKLPGYEVIKRLSENIEPREFFFFGFNHDRKTYQGNIEHNGFNISRVTVFRRNSFNPIIKGKLHEDNTGTTIEVKMRLHIFVGLFMIFWFSGVFIGILAAITIAASEPIPFILIPFVMLIFGYVLTVGSFKYESIRAKKHLAELFETEIKTS